eukprot:5102652-Lingulodinium_polyedra.AAC.1
MGVRAARVSCRPHGFLTGRASCGVIGVIAECREWLARGPHHACPKVVGDAAKLSRASVGAEVIEGFGN